MKVKDFAKLFRLHPFSVTRRINKGDIPAKMGTVSEWDYRKAWDIDEDYVKSLLKQK